METNPGQADDRPDPLLAQLKYQTFPEMLSALARRHRDDVYLHLLSDANPNRATDYTFGALYDLACAAGAALQVKGLQQGDRVVLVLPTGIDFLACFFGTVLAGGVPVPAYPPFGLGKLDEYLDRLAGLVNSSGASFLCTTRSVASVVGQILARTPSLRELVIARQLSGDAASLRPVTVKPDDTVLLQYTSGSTGAQKGVALSHRNILSNVHAIGVGLQCREGVDVGASWLPQCHDMGLIGCTICSLYWRVRYVLMSPQSFIGDPKRWLWAIHRYRVNVCPAPNFAYELCARKIPEEDVQGLDLSSWRIALNGAEPVSLASLDAFLARFEKHGFRREALFPVYGLAETSLAATFPEPGGKLVIDEIARDDLESRNLATPARANGVRTVKLVSVGRPVWGTEVRIVDEAGRPLPERRVGELQLRGPSVMKGYHGNQEATAQVFQDGWLKTGDLAYVSGGDVFIAGRLKDLIIKRGRNYHPQDIERAADRVPGVRAGCSVAFSVPSDAEGTESVVLLIETRLTDPVDHQRLLKELEQAVLTAIGLRPDVIRLLPPRSLPKTTSGKIQRRLSRQLFLEDRFHPEEKKGVFFAFKALGRSYYERMRFEWRRRDTRPET